MANKVVGVRLPEDLYKQVKAQAVDTGVTVQALVSEALESYLRFRAATDRFEGKSDGAGDASPT